MEELLVLGSVPVMVGALWPDRASARRAKTGTLSLAQCSSCALITNVAYDSSLVEYAVSYDNALQFSPSFKRYADELVEQLAGATDLAGKTILEIGCGKGDFLRALCERSGSNGIGYDPSYDGGNDNSGALSFRRQYFDPEIDAVDADLIICRHVIEHLPQPLAFLRSLRARLASTRARVYLEVPDARFVYSSSGMWDFIYPHVAYYGLPALLQLVARAGFAVAQSGSSFSGQYLWTELTTDAQTAGPRHDNPRIVESLLAAGRAVADDYEASVRRWRARLGDSAGSVVWGAGTKGVTFLNAVGSEFFTAMVDLNPRKAGRFVPGSGMSIVSPNALTNSRIHHVIAANAAYRDEIIADLQGRGINAVVDAI